jgi:4-deoxy-L-threo-5-hexosulose-uronate ketol-isomerase
MRYLPSPKEAATMGSEALRASFLVTNIFRPGEVTLEVVDLDRVVIGGAVPTDGPLALGRRRRCGRSTSRSGASSAC